MLSQHSLPKGHGKKKKRVGRGNNSSGNYSGRGMKGQRSRSGGKGGLKLRGVKQSIMKMPKNRGFSPRFPASQVVNVADLEKHFEAGATVTADVLYEKGLISSPFGAIKILGDGNLTKKLTVQTPKASKSAVEAIQGAGGAYEPTPAKKRAVKKTEKPSEEKK